MPTAPEIAAPAFCWVPEHTSTAAEEVADLAEVAGIGLDIEQRMALDALLAEKDGRWAAFEAALVAPRQNIKTHLAKVIALGDVTLIGTELVLWSAHEFGTAIESMRDLLEIIERNDFLDRRVVKVVNANGEEAIHFAGGRRIRFKARTKTGARGLTAPRLLLDEAFALQPAHIGSLMPTMSALSVTGNPQIVYLSSAGHLHSGVLRNLRDRGRAGNDPSLIWVEWCDDGPKDACQTPGCAHIYGTEGCVLDDETRWHRANLALGRRIAVDFVRMERRSLDPAEFARERLGWWDEPAGVDDEGLLELWAERANRTAELTKPVVLGLDVDHGQMSASITACGGSTLHVAAHRSGAGWLVDEIVRRRSDHPGAVVALLGDSGPARGLIPTLEKPVADGGAGLTVRSKAHPDGDLVVLDGPEIVDACELLLRGVLEGDLVHRDEHALNAAFAGAGRRRVGDGWRWSRRDSTAAVSPLTAGTAAYFVAQQNDQGGVNLW